MAQVTKHNLWHISSFLSPTSFCLTIVRVEGYCCILSHTVTHTHTHTHTWQDSPGRVIGPSQTSTINKHPCLRQDSNSQFQHAIDLRLRPRGHGDRLWNVCPVYTPTCVPGVRRSRDEWSSELLDWLTDYIEESHSSEASISSASQEVQL
jgi:hypothetical protein